MMGPDNDASRLRQPGLHAREPHGGLFRKGGAVGSCAVSVSSAHLPYCRRYWTVEDRRRVCGCPICGS